MRFIQELQVNRQCEDYEKQIDRVRFIQELQVNNQCEDYEKQIDRVRFSTGLTGKQTV